VADRRADLSGTPRFTKEHHMADRPYTPALRAGDWVVVSGQIGLGPDGLVEGFAAQLATALDNLRRHVEDAGATLDQVTKTTVFLADIADYAEMNDGYVSFFQTYAGAHRPTRSAVAVAALPMGALVEVEAWVHDPA
jgi:2-iminobutanoate/2-iminopropanoate deaminase